MSLKLRILFFCAVLITTLKASAQNTNNSPYSQYGIGDYYPQYFSGQAGMAGIGVSNSDGFHINNINPALLADNNRFTATDIGVMIISQKLASQNQNQKSTSGTLQYFSLAFPVTSHKPDSVNLHWTTGFTLAPYTNIYYKVTNNNYDPGIGSYVTNTKQGSGGLTKVDFNNGIKLNKRWYVGLKISYIFGDVTKEETISLSSGGIGNTLIYRVNQHGFNFKFGTAYRKKLNEKLFFNAGATYEISTDLNAKKLSYTQVPISSPALSDTLGNFTGKVILSPQYQGGISFVNPLHWTIGVDFTFNQGSSFKDFNNNSPYANGYAVSLGGEYTPNVFSYNLLSRMTYRAGINYTLTPIIVNDHQISDVSASLGTSLPVGRGNTMVNLGIGYGQRGTTNYNLVQENYFRINFGLTFNDLWFKRRKID